MPLKKCQKDGEDGYKWGDSGVCYTGPGARKKALKQGAAIEINKANFNYDEFIEVKTTEMFDVLSELDVSVGDKWAIIKKLDDRKFGK